MTRLDHLKRHTAKDVLGIEIAPYFNSIVTKSAGYNVLIVDVFDTDKLRELARNDPNIPDHRIKEIESVDIVSDASQLAECIERQGLSGKVGYIVSSHNFEHLPDPIRFLQGCSTALKPGGVLTMAIPDYRACFDHFRMPTRLSDWLFAYHNQLRQPSPETRFDFSANTAKFVRGGVARVGCDLHRDDPAGFLPARTVRAAYDEYIADFAVAGPYKDTHCSTVFGESFEILVRDLHHLGLIDLEVIKVTPTMGLEFFAYLRKPVSEEVSDGDDENYYQTRARLQRKINKTMGSSVFRSKIADLPSKTVKRLAHHVFGQTIFERLRIYNNARRARRNRG